MTMWGLRVRAFGREIVAVEVRGPNQPDTPTAPAESADSPESEQGQKAGAGQSLIQERRWCPDHSDHDPTFGFG